MAVRQAPDTSMPDFRAVARSEKDVLKDVVRRTDRSVVIPGSAAAGRPGEVGTDPMEARIRLCVGTHTVTTVGRGQSGLGRSTGT